MALGDKERAKELIDKSSSETIKFFEQETRQIHLAKDGKDGESVAFLELPKYVDEEIKKSIDINVDEESRLTFAFECIFIRILELIIMKSETIFKAL